MKQRFLTLLRLLETTGGITIFALALWMSLHVVLIDVANGQKLDRAAVIVLMIWVAPATVVLMGTLIQTLRRKRWPVVLVLCGIAGALPFVGMNALFIFVYTADSWGLRAVYTDLAAMAVTMVVSILNAALSDGPTVKVDAVEQTA